MDMVDNKLNNTSNIRIAVIIPAYNNEMTVVDVVEATRCFIPDIIVVNDGSTDSTGLSLSSIANIECISIPSNKGKGNALRQGFAKALARGFTHAITIDADGQHVADDIPLFISKIMEEPEALWIGNRSIPYGDQKQPSRSRFGARFGSFWYKFHTDLQINDTQCGFRAYPLKSIIDLNCKAERYAYEIDVLIKAAWNRIPVREIPIHLFYLPQDQAVSHFRPVLDFLRISVVNSKAALIRVFLPWRFLNVQGATAFEKIKNLFIMELTAHHSPGHASAALALGTFMGILPIHGLQVICSLGLAFAFRLNRALTFLGVSISSAPILPFWLGLGYLVGRAIVPGAVITAFADKIAPIADKIPAGPFLERFASTSLAAVLVQWFIGSIFLAFGVGIATFIIAYVILKGIDKLRRRGEAG
jgi:glycosyltransferase involved in cell wall biosynthesis